MWFKSWLYTAGCNLLDCQDLAMFSLKEAHLEFLALEKMSYDSRATLQIALLCCLWGGFGAFLLSLLPRIRHLLFRFILPFESFI